MSNLKPDPTVDRLPRLFVAQRRLLKLAAVLFIGVLVLRFAVGARHARQLEALKAEGERHGMPWTVADLDAAQPPMPDDQNAAVLYKQAFAMLNEDVCSFSNSAMEARLDSHPTEHPLFLYLGVRAEDAYGQVYNFARQARTLTQAHWESRYEATTGDIHFDDYGVMGSARNLAHELGTTACCSSHVAMTSAASSAFATSWRWRDRFRPAHPFPNSSLLPVLRWGRWRGSRRRHR
jgi:hypothetical protein